MPNKYTDDQINALKRCYPISDYDTIFAVFPGKTKKQIKSIASRYGIKSNNPGHQMDLSGHKYGLLTVEGFAYTKDYKTFWKCKCDCGNEIIAMGQLIKSGGTKSCGCLKHKPQTGVNHVGKRFGRLTAVERIPHYNNKKRTYYKCICDCGNMIYVSSSNLVVGSTRSCGCAQKDLKSFWDSIGHERNATDPVYSVYKHTAPNGKVYIGITRQNSVRRWQNGYGYRSQKLFSRAIAKYGWGSFKHEILEENLTEKEACEKEQYYIEKYRSNDSKHGYNATQGGDTSTNSVQPVMLYYKDKPVHFFESITDAANAFGVTSPAIRKYIQSEIDYDGYSFKKMPRIKIYDIPDEMYDIKDENFDTAKQIIAEANRKRIRKKGKGAVPICQYSLDGKFLRSYSSLAEAQKEYTYLSSNTLRGKHGSKSAYGYMWKYDNGDYSDIVPIEANRKIRKVIQLDPETNEALSQFESLADAERQTGVSSKQIYKACRGLHKTSGGYKWRYDN